MSVIRSAARHGPAQQFTDNEGYGMRLTDELLDDIEAASGG